MTLATAFSCDSADDHEKGKEAETVTFSVTGTRSSVDITYGDDSSNYEGPPNPPMTATLPVKRDAEYYVVTAQLQGSGNITCKVQIGDAAKVGHARGSFNICSAQLNRTDDRWEG
jgi:hypothetical protein